MYNLFQSLNDQTTLVTPNRRLSATLLKKYNQSQVNAGKSCWASLDILPLTTWIERLWHDYSAKQITATPILLTPQQEQILWEEILQTFPSNEALLQLSETAKLAKAAWGTLKQWQLELNHPSLKTTDDSTVFLLWATHFKNKCKIHNWLDANSLTEIICEKIHNQSLKLPQRLITTGFTLFSPLQKYLFACCEQAGIQVIHHNENQHTENLTQRISLPDEETEIRTMARWAKSLIETNKELNIGCVVPHLEKIRDNVFSIFSEVFSEDRLDSLNSIIHPYNITAGKNLASYPIIRAALELLSLHNQNMPIDNLTPLLLSPFLGDAEYEQIKRAQFDARLRKANILNRTLLQLINPHEKLNLHASCPRLAKRFEEFSALLRKQANLLPISTWIKVFIEALSLLGWPGERSINSQEYQIVQRWLELLNEYRTFDILLPEKSYENTLHYLRQLTSNVVFQPQGTDAPIQILGLLEAAGLPFNHTWVMGFDDSTWPPSAKPNPFIPHRLQASMKMPHSTAEHELEYSQHLTQQLIRSTQHIIFSHAKNKTDWEVRNSPLLNHIAEISIEQINLSKFLTLAEKCRQSQLIETIQDTQAPIVNLENTHEGGSLIFKLQAACPFKAFAELRLKARPLESPILGLTSKDRGKITHKALELIWLEIKNSETLHSYTDIELKNSLNKTIIQAIQQITENDITTSRYFSLEIERLQTLLWDWLQMEKSRPPFKVLAQEETSSVTLANIPIQVRIDRIDELKEGGHLIIDYKTGKNNHIKYWFGDRLDEPQLPLYCISGPAPATSIAFAEIHPDSLTLKGISHQNLGIDTIKPLSDTHYSENRSWPQQTLAWQQILEKLGHDFSQGHAEVDPKNETETCNHCHLKALCRISL
ncbi:MAG: recC [Gammaproteobacteria bacterium]|jgi:probable DNA repair protein|nr:recC [Gammaproteobacteria bacterium]